MLAVQALLLVYLTASQGVPAARATKSFESIAKQADRAKSDNQLAQAVGLYSEALKLRPTWSDGWWSLASLLYEQERFREAQVAFRRFTKVTPKPGPAYAFLALCEYETKDYERSLRDLQEWSKSGSPGNDALIDVAGYHWALLLTRKGQFQQALYLLAAKVKKLGPTPALTEAMGLASLRRTWLPSEYPRDRREMVWLAGKAAVYAARYDVERSNEFAQRLETHYPQEANVHYFAGTLLGFQSKFQEAAAEYKEELKLSPDHVPALTELAMAEVRSFNAADAIVAGERAVKLDPENARALYSLGKALLDTGRFQDSISPLESARRYAPKSSLIRSALASAYRHEGRLQDAKREAAAFIALQDKEETLAPLEEKPDTPSKAAARP